MQFATMHFLRNWRRVEKEKYNDNNNKKGDGGLNSCTKRSKKIRLDRWGGRKAEKRLSLRAFLPLKFDYETGGRNTSSYSILHHHSTEGKKVAKRIWAPRFTLYGPNGLSFPSSS